MTQPALDVARPHLALVPAPEACGATPLRGLQRAQLAFGGLQYADVVVAGIDGAVRYDEVVRGLHALVARHPTLRTRLDADGTTRVLDRLEGTLPLRFGVGDWRRVVEEVLNTPLGGDALPWRVEVVVHEGGAHVLLSVHHALVDGRALSRLLRDLLVALDEPGALGPSLAPAPSALDLADLPPWARWAAPGVRHAWTWRAKQTQRRAVLPGRRLARGEAPPTRFAARYLPPSLIAELRGEGQRHGATVGGALAEAAAASAEALVLRRGGADLRFDVEAMVDVRPRLRGAPDVGMYAGGVLAVRSGVDPVAPWGRARAATARTRQQMQTVVPVLAHAVFDGVDDPAAWARERGLDLDAQGGAAGVAQVSNVGVWDGPLRFGDRRVTSVWSATSAVRAGPALLVWLRTVGGLGCVTAIGNGAVVTPGQLDGWIDGVVHHLHVLAGR